MQMPLEDVKVLDLSHALAGPFCSTMLADFGAEVIKLEPKDTGDIARAWGPALPGGETSYFVSLHRNKKGIEVDLKHAEGKELFFRLMERCDVVLENYRVGALARLGLGYEAAAARNPGIIYCSVSGFGQDGPYRDRAALDLILQAESGMISVTGEPGHIFSNFVPTLSGPSSIASRCFSAVRRSSSFRACASSAMPSRWPSR